MQLVRLADAFSSKLTVGAVEVEATIQSLNEVHRTLIGDVVGFLISCSESRDDDKPHALMPLPRDRAWRTENRGSL